MQVNLTYRVRDPIQVYGANPLGVMANLKTNTMGWGSNWFGASHLRFRSLNLARCRHLFAISVLRFKLIFGSLFKISYFSVTHKSHFLVPHLYGRDLRWIFHSIFTGLLSVFKSHTCCDSLVAELYFWWQKLCL